MIYHIQPQVTQHEVEGSMLAVADPLLILYASYSRVTKKI